MTSVPDAFARDQALEELSGFRGDELVAGGARLLPRHGVHERVPEVLERPVHDAAAVGRVGRVGRDAAEGSRHRGGAFTLTAAIFNTIAATINS